MNDQPGDQILRGNLGGLRVTLIGLSRRTHVALARYLVRQGAIVRVSEARPAAELSLELALIDELPVEVRMGGHREEHVAEADVVFVTPGAPRELPILEYARRRGALISSEIELVFARSRAPIIGITGSAGKTTTTTLVGAMLRRGGFDVVVGGNIGVPLVERIDEVGPDSRIVLELSSFQLEGLKCSPAVGALLNVTPNHLDRHPSFDHYRESKLNLLRYQAASATAVIGQDDPVASTLAPMCPGRVSWFSAKTMVTQGAYRNQNELVSVDNGAEGVFARVTDLQVPGAHNVLNVLAAAAIARAAGVEPDGIGAAAIEFAGVEHRLEVVRRIDGVRYVNDSIATTPERTIAALQSFVEPIVLILGGRSKHLPLDALLHLAAKKTRSIVAYGEMSEEIVRAAVDVGLDRRTTLLSASTLGEAVSVARDNAQPGDIVLLSPAGTSFDQFRDFEERGQHYKSTVMALQEKA